MNITYIALNVTSFISLNDVMLLLLLHANQNYNNFCSVYLVV